MKSFLCLVGLLLGVASAEACPDTSTFGDCLAKAAQISTLADPGSPPFHLRLEVQETRHAAPQFKSEIEWWWAAPDKWRREIKSPSFSQTAVQNGERYYETNSSDYLPWWLNELVQASIRPIPLADLKDEGVDFDKSGCAKWETEFAKDAEKISIYESTCFNDDGTVKALFTKTISVQFDRYQIFGAKLVARSLTVWPGGPADVRGDVTILEPLKENESLFAIQKDLETKSRLEFVSIPEKSLEADSGNPPVQWPVIHNMPKTGAITINVKLDRDGKIREIGTIVSSNVAVVDAARNQVKNWRFKPYVQDGDPVQVNSNITLRYEATAELLGASTKSAAVEPFLVRIKKARELSDLRTESSTPFTLHAVLHGSKGKIGTYEETWLSPTKWWRRVQSGNTIVIESRIDDKLFRESQDSNFFPRWADSLLDALDGMFPRTDFSFHEADWGQSAVEREKSDMVRVARGQIDANNQPINGAAYWFDLAGLLRAAYVQPTTATYSEFTAWNGKQIPRRVELSENESIIVSASIDQLGPPAAEVPDSLFVLNGIKPELIGDPASYEGPAVVPAEPIQQVKPQNPGGGHGTVLLKVQLDAHGHVLDATVTKSAGHDLDDAAVRAAMQWEFRPMLIKGRPVPGFSNLHFQF